MIDPTRPEKYLIRPDPTRKIFFLTRPDPTEAGLWNQCIILSTSIQHIGFSVFNLTEIQPKTRVFSKTQPNLNPKFWNPNLTEIQFWKLNPTGKNRVNFGSYFKEKLSLFLLNFRKKIIKKYFFFCNFSIKIIIKLSLQ